MWKSPIKTRDFLRPATNRASIFRHIQRRPNLAFSLINATRRDCYPPTGASLPESRGLPAEPHGALRAGKLIQSINTCLSGRRALVNNQPAGCHLVECRHPSRASGKRRPALWLVSTRGLRNAGGGDGGCAHACTHVRTYGIQSITVASPDRHFIFRPIPFSVASRGAHPGERILKAFSYARA